MIKKNLFSFLIPALIFSFGIFITSCDDDTEPPQGSEEICDNNIDDDGDGLTDCDDPDCANADACKTLPEICDNNIDDDGDGLIDCADPDCSADSDCIAEICDNNIDDDGDGLTDCEDTECTACPEICDDGIDNDRDGKLDCDDSDCPGDCPETCEYSYHGIYKGSHLITFSSPVILNLICAIVNENPCPLRAGINDSLTVTVGTAGDLDISVKSEILDLVIPATINGEDDCDNLTIPQFSQASLIISGLEVKNANISGTAVRADGTVTLNLKVTGVVQGITIPQATVTGTFVRQ